LSDDLERLRRVPERWPGIPFHLWLQGLNDLQLVEFIAKCKLDREHALLELGAAEDAVSEVFSVLHKRGSDDLGGEIVARSLELWLADKTLQDIHESQTWARAEARRLLDEWEGRHE
jgi:hypothetical protein